MEKEILDLYVIERKTSSPYSQIIWKNGQKELIADLYINHGLGYRAIGKLFGEKIHYNTIKRIVESHEGKIRTIRESRCQEGLNKDIFKTIDTSEKAYWLGFLSADGCIHNGYITINLQERDKEHLEKFKKFLNSKNKVKTFTQKNKKYCSITIGNCTLCEDLISLGCVENKTLILKPCNKVPEEFIYDYIRGYWDGDGGISYSEKNNRWQAYCTSTKEMLEFFIKKMNINTNPFLEHNCSHTYRIHFNGRINVFKKMSLLYENSTIHLDRKKKLYLNLKETMLQL